MPRARTVSTDEEAVVVAPKKRAPRKRISRVEEGETDEVVTPKPRARRPRTVAPRLAPEPTPEEPVRRAPTPIQAERKAAKRGNRALVAIGIFFIVVAGSGVAIGMTDSGQIDVVAVVNERNERVGRGEVREGESTMTVPVQNMTGGDNGAMIPADPSLIPTPPPVPAETASSTATSTDETASSTEAVDGEEAETTNEEPEVVATTESST